MHPNDYQERFIDLTEERAARDYPMAVEALREEKLTTLSRCEDAFAVTAKAGKKVLMARTLSRPLRYFLAKRFDGPYCVVAERMDEIRGFCAKNGLIEQFHPGYTRMVPAHHVVELHLTGCPDPLPTYHRFFTPRQNAFSQDVTELGERYIAATYEAIARRLSRMPADEPVGVAFSGGIDSTSVAMLTHRAFHQLGRNPELLRLFTLSFGEGAQDAEQAVKTARAVGLADHHEIITGDPAHLDAEAVIRVIEDYQPLDVQCAAMNMALLDGIRKRYPDWRWMIDGDGGDENLKDYPLEGTEITTHSVLNNMMLYQEGWGVHSVKHSIVYSGGLSRSYTRTYNTARHFGFEGFSPFTCCSVIEAAEGIPFVAMTDYEAEPLYAMKGRIVAAGIKAVTGQDMPIPHKRRFQEGALSSRELEERLPLNKPHYRRIFDSIWENPSRGRATSVPA